MPAGAPAPATLRWAVVLLGVQTVGLVGVVALLIYADVRSTANSAAGATGLTASIASTFRATRSVAIGASKAASPSVTPGTTIT